MYTLIMKKPVHERPLRGHHMRIFLCLHPSFFLGGQIGAWIARRLFSKLGAMGWRHEFGRLFEDEWVGAGALLAGSFR
jgi:hypothetical protein